MLITNEHSNAKYESTRKFFSPELSTATNWLIGNLDQTLVKIDQVQSVRLIKENDKLKKVVKW